MLMAKRIKSCGRNVSRVSAIWFILNRGRGSSHLSEAAGAVFRGKRTLKAKANAMADENCSVSN